METMSKVCTKCKQNLPFSAYHKHAGCRFGLQSRCRACVSEHNRVRYKRDPEPTKRRSRLRHASMANRTDSEVTEARAASSPGGMKTCAGCKRTLAVTSFVLHVGSTDGLSSRCRRCKNTSDRKWREENRIARLQSRSVNEAAAYHDDLENQRARGRARYHRRSTRGLAEVGFDAKMSATGGLCAYCETNDATGQDHMIPISRGGEHEPLNVVPSCLPCNTSKGAKTPLEFVVYMIETEARTSW